MTIEPSPFGPVDRTARDHSFYHVSGFRSLQQFEIGLRPGLNVLVGVNGSGKTNFIDFLDFITLVVTRNTASAVSAAGGVARVFSQEALRKKIPRLTAKVAGLANLEPYLVGQHTKRTEFKFEYEIDIRYSKFHTAIYIANEKIKFKNLHNEDNIIECDATVGSIELHRASPLEDETPRWTVGAYLNSAAYRNPLRHIHAHRISSRLQRGRPLNEIRELQLAETPNVEPDESFLASRSIFPAIEAVRAAISRGRSFNLNPQRARTPDDISVPPTIAPDGSGLSAALYQMQQAARGGDKATLVRRRLKDALSTIISWTQIVIPDLTNITVSADPHTGKYLVFLHVMSHDGSLRIPLQSTSDGTLKWLAFVALIVSRAHEHTFEEPENFLHPMMQQYFVSLIREVLEEDGGIRRFILSTHSETLINQCKPEETILFEFINGRTFCHRIENAKAIEQEVNRTGFGMGHFYARNVLR